MNLYVISLTTASKRRAHITQEFAKHGVAFEFFDAITPPDIARHAARFGIDLGQSPHMSEGELACLFSHLAVWQHAIAQNQMIGVFEDDVHLGEQAGDFLTNSDWLPAVCDYLKLEHFMDSLHLGKCIAEHKKREIKALKSCNWGTAGYLIAPTVAKKLLALTQAQFAKEGRPIDHIMFEIAQKQMPIYQLVPALCIQSDRLHPTTALPSMLEQKRALALKTKFKKPLKDKLKAELTRPFRRVKERFTEHLKQPVSFK